MGKYCLYLKWPSLIAKNGEKLSFYWEKSFIGLTPGQSSSLRTRKIVNEIYSSLTFSTLQGQNSGLKKILLR
jgi:hypothetical protein